MIIDQHKIDEAVQTIIENGGHGILNCIQCGACSAVCPGVRAGFPLLCRNLIRHLLNACFPSDDTPGVEVHIVLHIAIGIHISADFDDGHARESLRCATAS